MTLRLTFEPPAPLLSMNDRQHYRRRSPIVREWRRAAWAAGCATGLGPSKRRLVGRQEVAVTLPVKGRLRRDPMNYVATVKAIVDGLTDAGLWPDDDAEHVTVREPVLDPAARLVVVRVSPAPMAATGGAPQGPTRRPPRARS